MTAINVLVMPGKSHVFADAGHHEGATLRYIAPKIYPLPELGLVFAWSGPSARAKDVLAAIERSRPPTAAQLRMRLPRLFELLGIDVPFSAIFAGAGTGFIADRRLDGELIFHDLEPGSMVKSLDTPIVFDPSRIIDTGVAMMEDQKARHKIVAGFIQYVEVSEGSISSVELRRWPDIVVGGVGQTHAAKITELEVDKITIDKFADNATIGCQISAIANGGSVVVPNEENLPVIFSLYFQMIYTGTGASSFCRSNWSLTRTRGSLKVAGGGAAKQGNVSVTLYMNSSGIDSTSQNNDTYTLTTELTQVSGGNFAMSNGKLRATYIKR